MIRIYNIVPMGAPRQTKKDAWNPSPAVRRYRAYRDEIRLKIKETDLPEDFFHVVYLLPMARSWPQQRRKALQFTKHQQKPDKDNLDKGLFDSIYRNKEDAHIWNSASTKLWAREGLILISDRPLKIVEGEPPVEAVFPWDFERGLSQSQEKS